MAYTISILTDQSRIPEIIALFRTGLGETTAEHWIWRLFTANGQEDLPFAVIAEDETGKIIGLSTAIPVRYGRSQRKCVLIGDWVVHPSCRGQGIIRKIFDFTRTYLSQHSYDFILVFPNANSYPIFLQYGFKDLTGACSWNSRTRPVFSRSTPSGTTWRGIKYRFSKHCPLTTIDNQQENRLYRTPGYLRWKYDQNPDTDYTWLSLWENSDLIGYFVYSLAKGRLRTAVNIYDWDYSFSQEASFIHAVSLLRSQGSYVSFWGIYSGDMLELLRKAGLKSQKSEARCIVRPLRPDSVPDQMIITRADTDY